MHYDDNDLPREPPVVVWTPADMMDALYYVSAAASIPMEVISEADVWRFRFGYLEATPDMDEWTEDRVQEYYRVRNTGRRVPEVESTDTRGVTSDELYYGK